MPFVRRLASRMFWTLVISVLISSLSFGGVIPKSDFGPDHSVSECKNVIFLIGDGMGFNSIEKTRHDCNVELCGFDAFTLRGQSQTASANNDVTDSAAGGTALACGIRTNNDAVGVYPSDIKNKCSHPMNLTELAVKQGKLAGVVTTDYSSGATPSAFTVHTRSRANEADITNQQLKSDLTVMWGAATASFTDEAAAKNGFEAVHNKVEMNALKEGSRSFGQFSYETWRTNPAPDMPTLTEMTAKAIDLLDDDPDGFFLMVEAAHIDINSHGNNGAAMEDALISFDSVLSYALEYAKTHGDTLVIVTADHETGGITLTDNGYVYTSDYHTGVNVPLLVYGCDDFMENGEVMENREVSQRVASAMGASRFPIREAA